jgi:signal transduction histidine kinase
MQLPHIVKHKFLSTVFFLFVFTITHGGVNYFDVKKGFSSRNFFQSVVYYKDCERMSADSIILLKQPLFVPMQSAQQYVKITDQDCYHWIKFALINTSEKEQKVFFATGKIASYVLYYVSGEDIRHTYHDRKKDYQMITVNPGDTIQCLVRHSFEGTSTNQYFFPYVTDLFARVEKDPELVGKSGIDELLFFMLIFCGMAGMMAIYLLINFFQLWDKSFLFYSLNTFCIVVLVILRIIYNTAPEEGDRINIMLAPVLQILSHLFYFLFASWFLNLKELLPALARFFRYVTAALVVYIIADLLLYFNGYNIVLRLQMFFWARIILIVIAFASIIYAYRTPTPMLRLFTVGTLLMVISATVSFIMTYLQVDTSYGLLSMPFFYFLSGYLLDIIFFTLCLGYKNRLEQQKKMKLEAELIAQRARERENSLHLIMETQEQERNRMAEDLHDELGSGLSTIRFLSESLKMKGSVVSAYDLHTISLKSAELIDNMRQIIWTVNPEHDNLADLLFYMKRYCGEYLETNKTDWDFIVPEHLPELQLPAGMRRNLFAIFKESLHNIVKHSGADKAEVVFRLQKNEGKYFCFLTIADNGAGVNPLQINETGNGLRNMRKRMKETGGSFTLKNLKDSDDNIKGAIVELEFVIPE